MIRETRTDRLAEQKDGLASVFGLVLAMSGAILAGAAALASLSQPFVGIDDANIFLTYARNIASGNGFVYYAGGERVEGFTSLAWVLICAAVTRFSERPELVLLAVNTGLVAVTVAGLLSFVRRDIGLDRYGDGSRRCLWSFQLALLCWTFFSPSYALWSITSLMESGLWGLILALGTVTTARSAGRDGRGAMGWGVAGWVAAALVTRPEAMMIALVWIATRFLALGCLGAGWKEALRRSAVPIAAYVIVTLGLLAFRLAYFGYPLPNTFYAKVSPSLGYNLREGFRYAKKFLSTQAFAGVALAASLAFVLEFARHALFLPLIATGDGELAPIQRWRGKMFVFAVSLLTAFAAPILTGGDHFDLFRFYQPLWPMLAVPPLAWLASSAAALDLRAGPRVHGGMAWVVVALGLLFTVYVASEPRWNEILQDKVPDYGRHEYDLARSGRALGESLSRILENHPTVSVGIITAGGIGVTYRGPIIDLMGLNNVRMGHAQGKRMGIKNHAAFNESVFYELAPDLVIPVVAEYSDTVKRDYADPHASWFPNTLLHGLLNTRRFREHYVATFLSLPGEKNSAGLVCYCKLDVVDRLRQREVAVELLTKKD